MKISDISTAKGLKFKLECLEKNSAFTINNLCRIEPTHMKNEFIVTQFGENASMNMGVLCKTTPKNTEYILDLFDSEKYNVLRCIFVIEGVNPDFIEIQAYTFQSITEYKTPIEIIVSNDLLEKTTLEKISKQYVWSEMGISALFCLNYKTEKKQRKGIRFISGRRYLVAENTPNGIFIDKESFYRNEYDVPIDVLVAPEIKFMCQDDAVVTNKALSVDLEKISDSASYFKRWEAYERLSEAMSHKESEEFGSIAYSKVEEKGELSGTTYCFTVDQKLDDGFKGKELFVTEEEIVDFEYNPKFNSDFENDSETGDANSNIGFKKPVKIAVGQIKRIDGNRIVTYKDDTDVVNLVPEKGFINLSTAGDMYIMARRKAARERIVAKRSPIKSLMTIIETGTSAYSWESWNDDKAVTEKLKRNFKKAVNLNPEQIKAIEVALNTPDIALIQGPPGTGKTTVIKAICERFREIFEAREQQCVEKDPDYILKSPKILISSFQNDAVDNAISNPLPGDIPAYRKTAKRTKENSKIQYQRALDSWYRGLCNTVTQMIEDSDALEFINKKSVMDDAFFAYKHSGEKLEDAVKIINMYLDFVEITYPQDLLDMANSIKRLVANDNENGAEESLFVSRIEALRTDIESFADDGVKNARKFLAFVRINDDIDLSNDIIECISNVIGEDYSDKEFEKYVEVAKELKKIYCKRRVHISIDDKSVVNECILNLSNVFNTSYVASRTSIESKKSLILSEFLSRLEQDYESIVRKYSITTAATCQTSLDFREDSEKIYDLVVVDEAARANPLDLFIPMSMGKKIVLVGDHKQLPHMLEPDVLKLLEGDSRFNDITKIEKSLFERLFDMFSKGQKPKALPLTQQYRMHPDICKFVSESFYDGLLKTAETVNLKEKSSPKEINNGKALTFVNIPITKGAETFGVSKSRWVEVEAIGKDVKHILEVSPNATLGIITFYSAQVIEIQNHLQNFLNDEQIEQIEIGTVDAFQGKEFDYVLLSCVRSNYPKNEDEPHSVGFLEKPNRLCVAFSRAIRQLIVYGDVETLIQIPCFSRLYEICDLNKEGCYREY